MPFSEPKQRLRHLKVPRVSDLDVALAPRYQAERDFGQVTVHDAAVVGGRALGEAGVGVGQLIGLPDHREPEALRRLAARQRIASRHARHHPVADLDDGVG